MSDSGNLIEILSGVIRGVIDGDIDPSQANAISATTAQIVKIAKLKIQHPTNVIDGVVVPKSTAITSEISSVEKLRSAVFDWISTNGPSTFKDIAKDVGVKWESIENIAQHEWFSVEGNVVSIA